MRKPVLLLSVFLAVMGVVAADGDFIVSGDPVATVIHPGDSAVAGEYEIGVRNESVTVTNVFVSGFPFEVAIAPQGFSLDASCDVEDTGPDGQCPWDPPTRLQSSRSRTRGTPRHR